MTTTDATIPYDEAVDIVLEMARKIDRLRAFITAAYDHLRDEGVDMTAPALLALGDEVDR